MTSFVCWDVTQCPLVVSYWHFGKPSSTAKLSQPVWGEIVGWEFWSRAEWRNDSITWRNAKRLRKKRHL